MVDGVSCKSVLFQNRRRHDMTCKLLLALAMSAVSLVGCEDRSGDLLQGCLDNSNNLTVAEVQELVDRGADVNARGEYDLTPLMHVAGVNPNPEVTSALLKAGAEINAKDWVGWTPLFYAAMTNTNPMVLSVLLGAGAEVNAKAKSGFTPLIAAAGRSSPEAIAVLLDAGAELNPKGDSVFTPLMQAASFNSPEVISLLLNAGADVNARCKTPYGGMTPLMCAARFSGNPEVFTVLLQAGADAKVKSTSGETALDLAKANEKLQGTQVVKELQEATRP